MGLKPAGEAGAPANPKRARAVVRLVVYVLVLVVACGASWFVASQMESSDQVAARAVSPEPVPVTAELRQGFLFSPVTMTTTAGFEQTRVIRPQSTSTGVVTAVDVGAGQVLEAGSAPVRVDGRPVFVLTGGFALYRDLRVGDEGDDVVAVQDGLQSAGYGTGRDRQGRFGAGTMAALKKMYTASGQVLPTAEVPPVALAVPENQSDGESVPAAPVPAPRESYLPRAEILMVEGLPGVVEWISAVGATLDSETELMRLGSGGVVLTTVVPAGSLGALSVGASGSFADQDGAPGVGEIVAVDPVPESAEVRVRVHTEAPVAVGGSYVLSFENPAGESGERLLAPVAAVVDRGGKAFVYHLERGEYTEVEVRVEDSVGGLAAITAIDPDAGLAPGVLVRVGEDKAPGQ